MAPYTFHDPSIKILNHLCSLIQLLRVPFVSLNSQAFEGLNPRHDQLADLQAPSSIGWCHTQRTYV